MTAKSHCGHTDVMLVACPFREPNPGRGSIVMVENVGNRVCRALFDLGERTLRYGVKTGRRKLIGSALEVKALDKIGLLADVEFDIERAATRARQVNPDIVIVPLSARTE
jgi:hydrogenase nickel incorporation protein HypB